MAVNPLVNVSTDMIDVTGSVAGGAVTNITVVAPLATTGGLTPQLSITTPIATNYGGTGQDLTAAATGYLKNTAGTVSVQAVPIPIADGGTNATVAPALNSVVYVGAGPSYTGDAANLRWDSTNKFLGVEVPTPLAPIDVAGSASATVPGSGLNVRAASAGQPAIITLSPSTGPSGTLLGSITGNPTYMSINSNTGGPV